MTRRNKIVTITAVQNNPELLSCPSQINKKGPFWTTSAVRQIQVGRIWVCEIASLAKDGDPAAALTAVRSEFPTVDDFEREFPSLCFAIATGVGKTRLMGAFISYHRSVLMWWQGVKSVRCFVGSALLSE